MKAVFPCRGSVIVNKADLDPMNAYYNMQLIRSNMNEYMKTSKSILQVGDFSYLPYDSNIILDISQLNDITTIKNALHIELKSTPQQAVAQNQIMQNAYGGAVQTAVQTQVQTVSQEPPITDDEIESNPFFKTLIPLD